MLKLYFGGKNTISVYLTTEEKDKYKGMSWRNYTPASPVHDKLMELSFIKADNLGIKNLKLNANLNRKMIDILGEKDNQKIGIECMTPYGTYRQFHFSRAKIYKPYVDKLIIAIPKMDKKIKEEIKELFDELWEFDLSEYKFGRLKNVQKHAHKRRRL